MSLFDFFRSICPFNYTTKSKEELEKIVTEMEKNSVFWTFDFNQSKTISIDEYVVFLALHRMSFKDLQKRFPKGVIDIGEFKDYMGQIKKSYNIELTVNNTALDSRLVKVDNETLELSNSKIYNILFEGNNQIKLSKLVDLKKQMFDELTYYEVI